MSFDHLHEDFTVSSHCSGCGEVVSPEDEACVHCGHLIQSKSREDEESLQEPEKLEENHDPEGASPQTEEKGGDDSLNTQTEPVIDPKRSPERDHFVDESDTEGIRVEKAPRDESQKPEKRQRGHYGAYQCPFEKGDILHLEINGKPKRLRLIELAFSTQLASGFFASDLDSRKEAHPAESSLDEQTEESVVSGMRNSEAPYFFEVYVSGNAPIENLSSTQCQLFRSSVGRGRYKGKPFRVYDESDSLSLETFVEGAKRRLPLDQIIALYRAILDLTICAHAQKSLVFGISPWTVRILNEQEKAEEDSEAEVVGEDFENETDGLDDEADSEENDDIFPEDAFDDPMLETLPSQASDAALRASFRVSYDDFTASEDETTFEIDRALPTATGEEAPLIPFGVQPTEPQVKKELAYKAVYDGLETLYPMGEMPESIPLISGFAASEFLLGVTQMVGPQADVFSLGTLLYYLVTGHVPPSSIHTNYSPALPMRNYRPDFPPGLEAVVQRATRVDPSERYESVRQLRNDFEHAIAQIQQRELTRQNKRNYAVVRAAVDRHVGIAKGKRMPLNQDSVFCGVVETGRLALVVVADGVTRATYGRGDIASKFVTEAAKAAWPDIENLYNDQGTFDPIKTINDILGAANKRLVEYVNENYYPFSGGLHEVMGSTVVIACVEDGLVTLGTLGDSRAYLFTDLGLEQLTVDHNLWTLNVLEGALPVDRVRSMPFADALARCVGSFRVVDQRLEALPPDPDIHQFFLHNGDRLLLSTDGLTDYVGINRDAVEDAIHAVLRREPDPALAALELILLANRGGGGDNIGIGVVDFH